MQTNILVQEDLSMMIYKIVSLIWDYFVESLNVKDNMARNSRKSDTTSTLIEVKKMVIKYYIDYHNTCIVH